MDPDTFAKVVAHERPTLVKEALRRTRNPADAEDVVQEALLRAWKRRGEYAPASGSPGDWLQGIMVGEVGKVRRARGKQAARTKPLQAKHVETAGARIMRTPDGRHKARPPLETYGPNLFVPVVEPGQRIEDLDAASRAAVKERAAGWAEGKTLREMAKESGVSKSQLHRMLREMGVRGGGEK